MHKLFVLVFLLAFSSKGYCWGALGHQIIGAVADERMNDDAKAMVAGILGMETASMASTWADENRRDERFTHNDRERDREKREHDDHNFSDYHFVDIPSGHTYDSRPNKDAKDSLGAILGSIKILKDTSASRTEREIAFKYLVHMIGDIHQPLHVGNHHDIGANFCLVYWKNAREPKNLHSVWDGNIVMAVGDALEEKNGGRNEEVRYLEHYINAFKEKRSDLFNAAKPRDVSNAAIKGWVDEIALIRENRQKPKRSIGIYPEKPGQMDRYIGKEHERRPYCMWFEDVRKGKWGATSPKKREDIPRDAIPRLDEDYLKVNVKLAEQQLLTAGIRLAAILDDITRSRQPETLTPSAQDAVIRAIQKTFKSF